MLLNKFLSLVLPTEGVKCWVSIKKGVKQGFTESFDDLSSTLQGIDSQHFDAYFACAAFKTSDNRKKENALCAKSFWLDIDAGEGKSYNDADSAISALEVFTDKVGIANPVIVRSGNGVHAYWILDRVLPAAEWQRCANNFKAYVEFHGLHADPTRTADISSILRAPGTYNWKDPAQPKPVSIEYEDWEITPAEFFINLPSPRNSVNAALIGNSSRIERPLMTQPYGDGERTDALLKRAGFCLGPDHMTEEQAIVACLAWNRHNTPPMDEDKVRRTVQSLATREAQKSPVMVSAQIEPLQNSELPEAPWPFSWGKGGVLMTVTEGDDGQDKVTIVSKYPIYLLDVCTREGEINISYVFRQWHPHRGWNDFWIAAKEFHGPGCEGILAERGTDIYNIKMFKNCIREWAVSIKGKKMDTFRYSQFGWKEERKAFLVGDTLIREGGAEEAAYGDEELAPRMSLMKLPKNGSLEQWTRAADRMYAAGMEAYSFTLLAAFAAPLMSFCVGESEGGAILSLMSGGSGRGKSRVLEAMASVWGSYDAVGTTGKDTDNSRFRVISKLCNLPVLEDELTQMDPVLLRNFVKDFTVGRDKTRARRDGSVLVRDSRYQTILICAANNSMYETVRTSGDNGAVARIFEIDMPETDSAEFDSVRFQDTLDTMRANRGYAGRKYVQTLMQPGMVQWVQKNVEAARAHYINLLATEPEHRYIVHLMTSMLVASAVVQHAGILHFDANRIMAWGETYAKERASVKSSSGNVGILAQFISEHMFDCLTVSGPVKNRFTQCSVIVAPTRGMKIRNERDTHRMYISSDAIKAWCQKKHVAYNDVVKTLTKKKILLSANKLTTITAGTDYPPVRVHCWEVDTANQEVTGVVNLVEVSPVTEAHSQGSEN